MATREAAPRPRRRGPPPPPRAAESGRPTVDAEPRENAPASHLSYQAGERRLAAALDAQLMALLADDAELTREVVLHTPRFADLEGPALVVVRGEAVLLNRRHPVIARLVADGPLDPLLVAVAASALCTALNHAEEAILDSHERLLQRRLVDALVDRARR